ncbi:creatininase family protein [Devosia sp. BK]|uniref:creatininase family protein n=1 Tax=Devosia sp. BK TaxID=2871706 RepID=UPI00293B77C8|nr:creatininase family protein [Devosia sp. BK]MDV3251106.1 creatininase family protein [Devosia sp. BK]
MKISDMNWFAVEDYLRRDDRAIIPLGSTEQHAYLSNSVDSILAEKVAVEAADPTGVPVFPVLAYGITPYFTAYPGSVSLRAETYGRIITDMLDSLAGQGFRRFLFVNGHGGNSPGQTTALEWLNDHADCRIRWHNWWNAPKTFAKVQAIDPVASHASWMENFAWTRLPNIGMPSSQKTMSDLDKLKTMGSQAVKDYLGDGNFGGFYQRPDEEMQAIWDIAIDETRSLIENGWA